MGKGLQGKRVSELQGSINDVLNFLTKGYKKELSSIALKNVIWALSNGIPYSVRNHHTVKTFMGLFNLPPKKTNSIQFEMLINYYKICNVYGWKEYGHK